MAAIPSKTLEMKFFSSLLGSMKLWALRSREYLCFANMQNNDRRTWNSLDWTALSSLSSAELIAAELVQQPSDIHHWLASHCPQPWLRPGVSIPLESMMHFPPCFRFSPISEKIFWLWGTFFKFYLFPKNFFIFIRRNFWWPFYLFF